MKNFFKKSVRNRVLIALTNWSREILLGYIVGANMTTLV